MSIQPDGKTRVSLSLKKTVKEIGEKRADEEVRSFSNYVETLILRDSKRNNPTTTAVPKLETR